MSVIFFDVSELANVAKVCLLGAAAMQCEPTGPRVAILDALATYSQANARAYNRSYPRERTNRAVAWTVADLARELGMRPEIRTFGGNHAFGVLKLLRYNAVSNGGKDYSDRATLSGIVTLYQYAAAWIVTQAGGIVP